MMKKTVTVDPCKILRPVGKLNGMNNGPIHLFTDRTKEYKEMGADFVRFHETHSFNTKCIEVPFIFRDFSADENDPANYYFGETDAVIKGAVDAGIEIMYRLGMGTESTQPRIFCVAPTDFGKWARVAEHIIMHYNEGWANGFRYNIRYWEIWNEPDLLTYWSNRAWKEKDTRPKFIEFYCVVSHYLKKRFPDILVGAAGMATTRPAPPAANATPQAVQTWKYRMEMYDLLGAAIRDGKALADFFAFHSYHGDIKTCRYKYEQRVKGFLGDFGLTDLEVINTEWNGVHLRRDPKGVWFFDQMYTSRSTTDCLATMLIYQKNGVSKAAYYDADDRSKFCGLYEFTAETYKCHAYAMMAFKRLREAGEEVACEGFETQTTTACAAIGNGKLVIEFSNDGADEEVTLKIPGLAPCDYTVTLLDTKFRTLRRGRFTGRALPLTIKKETSLILEFDL